MCLESHLFPYLKSQVPNLKSRSLTGGKSPSFTARTVRRISSSMRTSTRFSPQNGKCTITLPGPASASSARSRNGRGPMAARPDCILLTCTTTPMPSARWISPATCPSSSVPTARASAASFVPSSLWMRSYGNSASYGPGISSSSCQSMKDGRVTAKSKSLNSSTGSAWS